jgi:MSHA biogenesis protein MshI
MLASLLNRFKRERKTATDLLCLQYTDDALLAAYSPTPVLLSKPQVVASARSREKFSVKPLRRLLAQEKWQDCRTCFTLDLDDYRVLLQDKPNIAPEELAQACKWLTKDLIDFPLEQAAVDVFLSPTQLAGKNKVYVIVTKLEILEKIKKICEDTSLELFAVDIPELALRNLIVSQYPSQDIAVLYGRDNFISMVVISDLNIQFIRKVNANLKEGSNLDSIALELQRSLDYYQSQMRRPPPHKLLIAPSLTPLRPDLVANLDAQLTVQVAALDCPNHDLAEKDWLTHYLVYAQALRLHVDPLLKPVSTGGSTA